MLTDLNEVADVMVKLGDVATGHVNAPCALYEAYTHPTPGNFAALLGRGQPST
ncbi:MAG: hypothetical protein ACI9OJ_003914 [Myxococcota bacterium]